MPETTEQLFFEYELFFEEKKDSYRICTTAKTPEDLTLKIGNDIAREEISDIRRASTIDYSYEDDCVGTFDDDYYCCNVCGKFDTVFYGCTGAVEFRVLACSKDKRFSVVQDSIRKFRKYGNDAITIELKYITWCDLNEVMLNQDTYDGPPYQTKPLLFYQLRK